MTEFVVEADLVIANLGVVRAACGGRDVIAVLKGNGYGLGLLELAHVVAEAGVRQFAVTDPADALRLRGDGLTAQDILILRSTALPEDLAAILDARAIATVGSPGAAAALERAAEDRGLTAEAHVEIDTGMGRYGFLPTQTDAVVAAYRDRPHVRVTGLYTHYARAFEPGGATAAQAAALRGVADRLRAAGVEPGLVHASNSAAVFNHPELDHFDAVRIGSALTGRVSGKATTRLQRVGSLRARVVEVRDLPAGRPIGYGGTFVTRRPTRIAVVPVGYADGFMVEKSRDSYHLLDYARYVWHDTTAWRHGGATYADLGGHPARVLGRVGLNHTVLDVTGLPCAVGDEAVFTVNPLLVPPAIPRRSV